VKIAYLVPVLERAFGPTWRREPEGLDVLRGASGFQGARIHHPRGALLPATVLVVDRDTLTNAAFEAAVPDAVKLGDADRFDALWTSTDPVAAGARRTRIAALAGALGIDLSDLTTLGPIVQRIWRRLEPAAAAGMYDVTIARGPETIFDDFNRADEALTAGSWLQVEGTNWAVVSNQARETAISGIATCRRSEAAGFPDNQYAQVKCLFTIGGISSPAARMDATGTSYVVVLSASNADLYYHTGGGGVTLVQAFAVVNVISTFLTIKIDCQGTTIAVDREGANIISTTDGNVTAGRPGMACQNANQDLDDFQCTDSLSASERLRRPNVLRPRPFAPGIGR
jgi:hypothetical protein